jgi:hypothetical protein
MATNASGHTTSLGFSKSCVCAAKPHLKKFNTAQTIREKLKTPAYLPPISGSLQKSIEG